MLRALAGAVALTLAAPSYAQPPEKKAERGFQLSTPDGAQKLRIGGLLQVDGLTFPGDVGDRTTDNVRLRRARVDIRSQVGDILRLRLHTEFANGPQVLDANLELAPMEQLRIRLGRDKVPVSADFGQLPSNKHFLERSMTLQTAPLRDLALQVLGTFGDRVLEYQLGLFTGAPDGANVESNIDDRFDLAGRVTFSPWSPLRLGASFSHGIARGTSASSQLAVYRTAGRAIWFQYLSGAGGTAVADGERTRLAAHLMFHYGPVGIFSEVMATSQEVSIGTARESLTHLAWVGQVSAVLTGEKASFAGVEPLRPVWDGGPGAIELSVRLHGLDIDDQAFSAGFADPERSASGLVALTVGATWYLDINFKAQLNYERSTFSGGASNGFDRPAEDLLGLRLQQVF